MPPENFEENHPLDRPYVEQVRLPLHAEVIFNQMAQNIAFARAHLTHAETSFEQFKQALGR
jgi:hypothetical protein